MQRAGGITIDEAYSISLDGNSNTYTTGYFSGSATFGSTVLTCTGVSDIFVACTDKNGVFKWAVKAGGTGSCRGLAIKTDVTGNSYVTGFFDGSATFGTKTITSAGLQDAFVAKYDNTGALLWVVDAGGPKSDIGNAITIDNSGNIAVTGEFTGTAMFGSNSLSSTNNNVNVFTTRLDPNGNFLWAKSGVGRHTDRGLGVACDPSGNVYVTGQYTDTITFDNAHYSTLYNAIFLVKYNSSGVEQWFTNAGGGTSNIANAIAVDNNSNIYLAGDFTGILSFFVSPVVTLSGTYANRIFVAKYNSGGNLLWDVQDGSSNSLTAKNIALDGSGNAYVIGNFECIMNGYADHYGQGTFNTVGYWDIFVAEYGSVSGAWQWSRQIGGRKNNLGYGIAVNSTGDIFTVGSFDQDMIVTSGATYIGYNSAPVYCNNPYCSDSYYGNFESFNTVGNYDVFIAKPIDLNRQPYDYYIRPGSSCVRPQIGICINNCIDTVTFCGGGSIYATTNTCTRLGPQAAPNYNYVWSNGQNASSTYITATGWYHLTQTSVDGCFKSSDSIYVVINPVPLQPTISGPLNKCKGSVLLTGGGYGSNSFSWSNGSTTDTTTIDKSGKYCFTVVNSSGCSAYTCVNVTIDTDLLPIKSKLICITCKHDTAAFCRGNSFTMFTYDSITNPTGNTSFCIPPSATIKWWAGTGPISYTSPTHCPIPPGAYNNFTPQDSGWYHITDTILRRNLCDTTIDIAHDSVFVRLYPVPTIAPVSIVGKNSLCPGDSTLLIAKDTNYFVWKPTGSTSDSIWGKPGGFYSISSMITNSYGCAAIASASIYITIKSDPTLIVTPTTGLICPNDSLKLTCTGSGSFTWYGPSGPVGNSSNTVYVKTPGAYYCVVTDSNYCHSILSNTVNINIYATPYLAASPNPVLCPGDSIVISVISSAGSVIKWLPPLSGNDSVQVIKSPGTYSCQISSCGIVVDTSITITRSNPLAKITASGPTTFCDGDSVMLTANTGMSAYSWTPGSVNGTSITVLTGGEYLLTTIDNNGCIAHDSVLINVTPNNTLPPHVADTVACPGETVTLTVAASGNITWYSAFSGGSVLATGNTYTTSAINNFTVFYIDNEVGDCRSHKDSVSVNVTDCGSVYVPNVFTPNGDGDNDTFLITIKGAKCFDCKIYNRWGVLIYEWNDVTKGWDGIIMQTKLPASDGTYYYILNYCNYQNVTSKRDGFLTLIRK